jgi:hypothetical protein
MAARAEDYTFFNPHLSVQIDCLGRKTHLVRSRADWVKWMPNQPPCAHWYETEELAKHMAACITKDQQTGRDRTLRGFVAGFAGLTSPPKQARVLGEAGLKRSRLSDLVREGDLDRDAVERLLVLMKRSTKRVKQADLGFVGEEHLQKRFESMGCKLESFRYGRQPRKAREAMDVPWSAEAAFAFAPEREGRRLVLGVNWSPSIANPFRSLDEPGEPRGSSLEGLLEHFKVSPNDPVVFALHVACARVRYTDRGKTALVMDG